jgi:hypothetical protein
MIAMLTLNDGKTLTRRELLKVGLALSVCPKSS